MPQWSLNRHFLYFCTRLSGSPFSARWREQIPLLYPWFHLGFKGVATASWKPMFALKIDFHHWGHCEEWERPDGFFPIAWAIFQIGLPAPLSLDVQRQNQLTMTVTLTSLTSHFRQRASTRFNPESCLYLHGPHPVHSDTSLLWESQTTGKTTISIFPLFANSIFPIFLSLSLVNIQSHIIWCFLH